MSTENKHVDCGDNSCICVPPEHRKGMRTNGGCRCCKELPPEHRLMFRRAVLYWKTRALDAEKR